MGSNYLRYSKGYTILEILTVSVIITILVSIAIPNFINNKEDANEAVSETNARTLRIMLETYKVDQQIYPESLRTLGYEATAKKYNKTVNNPFTGHNGLVESGKWAIDYVGNVGPSGMVAYQPIAGNSKYYIFIYDRKGNLLIRKGKIFTMDNG